MLKYEVGLELCVLGLGAVALDSNAILNSGQDLFPVVLDSSLTRR